MDGSNVSVSPVEEYASWLEARYNGKRLYAFPMGKTHNKIVKELDNGRFSFEEVVTLFAGIVAKRYCEDRVDARSAIGRFADNLLEIVGKDGDDEDCEMVDRIDAGGF